jgi:hypothetical protein
MANTTIGSNPAFNNWLFDGAMHQAWIGSYTPGAYGRMVQVNSQFAAQTGGGAGGAVAWLNGASGAALYQNKGPIGAGNGGTGGGTAVRTSNGDVPFDNNDFFHFGFYCANGVFTAYHTDGGASFVKASAISAPSGGTNYSAYGSGAGSQIAFGTYFILETYIRRTGAWSKRFIQIRRGAGYSTPQVHIWRGGWIQVGQLIRRGELDWKRELTALVVWPDKTEDRALLRWDYDRPRYIGAGYPGWVRNARGIMVPNESVLARAA